jgi:hypothetical protein
LRDNGIKMICRFGFFLLLACCFGLPPIAAARDNPCEVKYADQLAAEPGDAQTTYVLIGVPQYERMVTSVVVSPYDPQTQTVIYGNKHPEDCSVLFNINRASFVHKIDGRETVFHLVKATPRTYAIPFYFMQRESVYMVCLADETYAFEAKPGRINYIGTLKFKPTTDNIRKAAGHGPGYRTVDRGAPYGIEGIDQNVDLLRESMKPFAGIGLPIEPTANSRATFKTDENWLGTQLCYTTNERER